MSNTVRQHRKFAFRLLPRRAILPNAFMLGLGLLPTRLFVLWSVMGVPEAVLATLAGAWIYREPVSERIGAYDAVPATAR